MANESSVAAVEQGRWVGLNQLMRRSWRYRFYFLCRKIKYPLHLSHQLVC